MHTAIYSLPFLLQQATATFPDTIYTKQVSMGFIQQLGVIASALMTLAVLLLAIALLIIVWYFRGIYTRVNRLIDRVDSEVIPLVQGTTGLTGDLREIVKSVRGEVHKVQETTDLVTTRVQAVVHRVEERFERFETLLDLVEEEAAATVVSATAAVRGVRTGLEELFDHNEGADDGDEGDDGDYDDAGATYARPTRPRVRPRWDEDEYE